MNDLSVASERPVPADAVLLSQDGAEAAEPSLAFGALVAAAQARDENGAAKKEDAQSAAQPQQGEGAEALSAADAAPLEASDAEAQGELADGFASSLEGATTEAPAVPAFWGRPMVAYARQGAAGRGEAAARDAGAADLDAQGTPTTDGELAARSAKTGRHFAQVSDATLAQRYGRAAANEADRAQGSAAETTPTDAFAVSDPQSPACLAQAAADAERALGASAAQNSDDADLAVTKSLNAGGKGGGSPEAGNNALFVRLGQDAEMPQGEALDDAGPQGEHAEMDAEPGAKAPTGVPSAQARWNAARAFGAVSHAFSAHGNGRSEANEAAAENQPADEGAVEGVATPSRDGAAIHLASALVGAAASLAARAGAAVGPSLAERVAQGATSVAGSAAAPAAGSEDAAGDGDDDKLTEAAPGQGLAELGAALSLLNAAAAPATGDGGARALDAVRAQAMAADVTPAGAAASAFAASSASVQPDAEGATDDATNAAAGAAAGQAPAQSFAGAAAAANASAASEGDAAVDAGADQVQEARSASPAPELRRPSAVERRNAAGGSEPSAEEAGKAEASGAGRASDASGAAQAASVGQATPPTPAAAARAVAAAQAIPQAEVSRELAEAVHHGSRSISLRVAPPGVGELGINVRVIAGQVRMRVAGDAPALEQALRTQLPALQQSLQDRGLTLASFDVQQRDTAERDQPGNFDSFQQQSGGQQNGSTNEEDRGYAQAAREGRGMIARAASTAATSAAAPSSTTSGPGLRRTLYVTV